MFVSFLTVPPSPPPQPPINFRARIRGDYLVWTGDRSRESRLYFCSLQWNQSMRTCRIHLGFPPVAHAKHGGVGISATHTRVRALLLDRWSWLNQRSTGSRSWSMLAWLVTTECEALSLSMRVKTSPSSGQSHLTGSIFFYGIRFHLAPTASSKSWSVAYSTADWSCMQSWKLNLELSKPS